jgi:ketosteroid isomerase-like protein
VASEADLASIRRGFELFNAGDLETLFRDIFHPEVDYSGDPDISILTGLPVMGKGAEEVRELWQAFFAMFDEVAMEEIQLDADPDGNPIGSCRMMARGGASKVPIDAEFHFAWVLREGRWRFLAAKLDRDQTRGALAEWLQAEDGPS